MNGAESLVARKVHQASPEGTTWGLYLQGPGRCPQLNSGFRDEETDRTECEGQIRDSDADDEAIAIKLSVMAELSDIVNAREDAPKRNSVKKSPPQAVFSSTPQTASNGAAHLGLACQDSALENES